MRGLTAAHAILFDLDGVLVHSAEAVDRAWRRWADEHAMPVERVVEMAHGRRTVDTIRLLIGDRDAPAEAARLEAAQARDTTDVSPGMGAADLIGRLSPDEWGVVTSGTRDLALSRLDAAGLPYPKVLIAGDDVRRGKPAPDGYLRGATALGQRPSRCVVVEDAAPGVQAARAAGCQVIAVTHGGRIGPVAAADLVVGELTDLRLRRDAQGLVISTARTGPLSPTGGAT